MSSESYDALIVVSFGGPEGPDDVMPFLENVLRGKNVPRERMLEVSEHYKSFGGISPINEQNRHLISALQTDFRENDVTLPIYFGNRNWHPLLTDTLAQMRDDGIKRALAFFTSAYSSYSGCRQYRENIKDAQEQVGEGAPVIEKVRHYFNHPGFIETMTSMVENAIFKLGTQQRNQIHLAFSAHSIPESMASSCNYELQLREASRLVAESLDIPDWELVYQSRSGPPTQPWLEPDICDHLRTVAERGKREVIIVPIGFISDHMEVLFDLDTEAREVSEELRIKMVRASTAGTHPRFVRMIRELVLERMTPDSDRPFLGTLGPSHDVCPIDCCPRPQRPQRPAAPS